MKVFPLRKACYPPPSGDTNGRALRCSLNVQAMLTY